MVLFKRSQRRPIISSTALGNISYVKERKLINSEKTISRQAVDLKAMGSHDKVGPKESSDFTYLKIISREVDPSHKR